MKISRKSLVLIFLIFALSSCVTTKRVRYLQDPGCSIPEYQEKYTPEDYVVQVLDELYVHVTTLDPEMTELFNLTTGESSDASVITSPGYNSYTVNENGTISFPYIGNIYVVGKTTRQIKRIVSDTLSVMVKDLSVDVKLMNSYFSILGDVRNGRYPITKERLNVFQALALAGDMEQFSDRAHIKIIRQTSEGTVVRTFDIRSKDIIGSEFYYIQPNDVIYVQSFNGQFFGLSSFTSIFTVITSVVSLALIIIKFNDIF